MANATTILPMSNVSSERARSRKERSLGPANSLSQDTFNHSWIASFQGGIESKHSSTALRLLNSEDAEEAAARASEVDRIRQSYSTVLEGNIRMKALQAKQEATLQALKGGLLRRELSSQVLSATHTKHTAFPALSPEISPCKKCICHYPEDVARALMTDCCMSMSPSDQPIGTA